MKQTETAKRVGRRIRALRTQKGLTQKQLGTLAGLRAPEISKAETGHREPRLETYKRIADALEVPLYVFFIEEDPDITEIRALFAQWVSSLPVEQQLAMFSSLFTMGSTER